MAKINRKNASERIADMLSEYEMIKRDNHYGGQDRYYLMSEAEYKKVLENVIGACTKELATYIDRYSDRIPDHHIDSTDGVDKYGCLIRTWGDVYAAVVFK